MRTAATVSCIKGERVVKCLSVDFDTHRLVHNRGDQGLSLLDIRMALSNASSEGGDAQVHAPPVITSWKAHSGAILRVQMQGDRIVTGSRDKTAKGTIHHAPLALLECQLMHYDNNASVGSTFACRAEGGPLATARGLGD
jgi:hypothetical protein